jgi:hypothetical protein
MPIVTLHMVAGPKCGTDVDRVLHEEQRGECLSHKFPSFEARGRYHFYEAAGPWDGSEHVCLDYRGMVTRF